MRIVQGERRDTRIGVEASLLPPLFERPGVGMVSLDVQGQVTAMSPFAEAVLGFDQDELLGVPFHERVHYQRRDGAPLPEAACPIRTAIRRALAADGAGEVFVRKDGTTVPVAWAVAPIVLAGLRTGAVLAFYDDRTSGSSRQLDRLQAVQAANIRLALLADVSHALIRAGDLHAGLADVAGALVPDAADWVVIDLLHQGTGRIERAAVAHRNPAAQLEGLATLGAQPPLEPGMTSPLAQVLLGAGTLHLTSFPPAEEAVDALGAARLALFHRLGTADALTAPLRTRSRTVGAITLVRSDPNRPYEANDLTFVEELATRIAFAVDNATLLQQYEALLRQYERRAETVQRSLLPEVPAELRGVQLVHHYRPADDLAKVGGDWFDAFALRDGSVALVVGDVVGHDLHAATRMGAMRHKLRAIATDRAGSPSQVLGRLDDVVQQLGAADLATLVYARLVPAAPATPGPAGWTLEWSNAGHPPPLLIDPDGGPRLLDPAGNADLPIGVDPGERADHRLALPGGAVVVLFTDGLVERVGESLDDGLARLLDAARTLRGEDLDRLPERLVAAVDPAADDDLAILAVRLP